MERHREELQRQVAALDSQVAIGRARLDDAAAEAANLNQRLTLERNRQAGDGGNGERGKGRRGK